MSKDNKDKIIKHFEEQLNEIHSKSKELKERAIKEGKPTFEPIEPDDMLPEETPLTLAWEASKALYNVSYG